MPLAEKIQHEASQPSNQALRRAKTNDACFGNRDHSKITCRGRRTPCRIHDVLSHSIGMTYMECPED